MALASHWARILLIEDDQDVAATVSAAFGAAGVEISAAGTWQEAGRLITEEKFDACLLDLGLPDADGLSLLRRLADENFPVIVISGRDTEIERIAALEIGADDFIGKPFSPREALARLKAVLRRRTRPSAFRIDEKPSDEIALPGCFLSLRRSCLVPGQGIPIHLSLGELSLLRELVRARGRLLSRDFLIERTHGTGADLNDRSVDVTISRLRRKLSQASGGASGIETVRGLGYVFSEGQRSGAAELEARS